jgi:hypothetical protein
VREGKGKANAFTSVRPMRSRASAITAAPIVIVVVRNILVSSTDEWF